MIKHVVMWKLLAEADGRTAAENALEIKKRLEALAGEIPQIRELEVGVNINKSDAASDAVLVSVFDSMEDLDAYQNDPRHRAVVSFVGSVAAGRTVADYEF